MLLIRMLLSWERWREVLLYVPVNIILPMPDVNNPYCSFYRLKYEKLYADNQHINMFHLGLAGRFKYELLFIVMRQVG